MTEEHIERIAEYQMNVLDAALISGRLTQKEYDAKVAELDKWLDSLRYPKASRFPTHMAYGFNPKA